LHVAFVLSGLHGGGSQRRLLTLAREALARGHRVDVVAGTGEGPFRDRVPGGARLVSLLADGGLGRVAFTRSKTLRMAAALPAFVRYLKKERPEVMLASGTPTNLAAIIARRLARVRTAVVVSVNVPVSVATVQRSRPLLRRMVRRWYSEADAVIANAAALADDLTSLIGLGPDRVIVIANPIDIDEIRRLSAAAVEHPWLSTPGEASGEWPPVILAVGKLKPQKDFSTLIAAFAIARRQRPLRLLILGEGEQREALLRLSETLGVAGDVALPGFVANPFAYMARAAMLVQTSRWEGFSNVVAEALACGCPVVATACAGGTSEILANGRFGRLVGVGDERAIAAAILATLVEAPPREELRRRAESFGMKAAVDRYLEVLAGCLESRSGTAHEAGTRTSRYSSTA